MVAPTVSAETTMKLSDTKQHLSQVINQVARGERRVVVEKSGLPVAAIISVDEYRRFQGVVAETTAANVVSCGVMERAGLTLERTLHEDGPYRSPGSGYGGVEYALTR